MAMVTHLHTNIRNTRLGLLGVFAFIVLIFSDTRGLIPLLTGNASLARPTYSFSFILGTLLSLFGLHLALFKKNQTILKRLRLLLIINLVLQISWLIPVIIFRPELTVIMGFFYLGLFPFAVFGLARLSEKYLVIALSIVTLVVAGTVILEFIQLNTSLFPNGLELATRSQLLLRSETFESFGNTAGIYRPVGILGHRPHDAGNLLAVLSAYWIAMLFRQGRAKIAISIISAIAISGMLMTQSAANIAAFFVGTLFIIVTCYRKIFSFIGILRILLAVLVATIAMFIFTKLEVGAGMFWVWSKRISSSGDWGGMTALGITDIGRDLFAVLVGHGSSLGLSEVGGVSEAAFLKGLMELGVLAWAIFLITFSYPILCCVFNRSLIKQSTFPYISALVVGFVSLWHYGSIVRITNIFVFFALYAQVLRIFANERLIQISQCLSPSARK